MTWNNCLTKKLKSNMKDFNSKRFAQFVKWDATINAKLYRTMAIVIFCTTLAFALLHFIVWQIGNGLNASFSLLQRTGFLALMNLVSCCAGFLLHNFRTKPKRILEMTMPASNCEKFLSHVLLTIIGSILVLLASMVVADGIHALLTWAVMDKGQIVSLFSTFDFASTLRTPFSGEVNDDYIVLSYISRIFPHLNLMMYSSIILSFAYYAFSNTVLYKYNIPAAYVIMYVLSMIISISIFIALLAFAHKNSDVPDSTVFSFASVSATVWTAINLALTVILAIATYFRYTKAQLVNRLNR